MKAILLAAGEGRRLRPLTDSIPKCLVPIAGRPLLDYWLRACEKAGFDDVLINTHHHAEQVNRFLEATTRRVQVRTYHEERLLGTAGTLRANWEFVCQEEVFLFAHADSFTDLELLEFLGAFRAGRRSHTVLGAALFRSPTPQTCGIVRLDGTGHIIEFLEKPASPPGNLANGAIYLGTPQLGAFLRLEQKEPRELDFSTQVIPRLLGRIWGYELRGFLADIGAPEQYEAWKNGPATWASTARREA